MSITQPGFVAGRSAVRNHLRAVEPTAGVVVACSGGADSLALAACVAAEARRLSVRAGAVVVDHQMQTGSAAVANRAAEQCTDLGLAPVRVVRVDVDHRPAGSEAGARDARYAVLEEVREAIGADAVLLGHTLDDQAETVLLGLARGSGARSLSGMAAVRGALRRPFLGLTRATTETICSELGLTPWDDPTNLAPRETHASAPAGAQQNGSVQDEGASWPLRSRVRASLLPMLEETLGPGVAGALSRSAEMFREDDEFLTGLAQELFTNAVLGQNVTYQNVTYKDQNPQPGDVDTPQPMVTAPDNRLLLRLDVSLLAGAAAPVRRRALLLAAGSAGSPSGAVTRTHILGLDALVEAWRGQGPVHLPGNLRAWREYGTLVLGIPTS